MEQIAGNTTRNPLDSGGSPFTKETINDLIGILINIIDDRIERRLGSSDIIHLYDAQLMQIKDRLNAVAEYNDVKYNVKNATGIAFTDDDRLKYVKMGTVDGINHIALYKLDPDAVDVDEIKNEIQKMKNEMGIMQKYK
ncbi:MAG: hypothetical protein Q4G33_10145 [bacterium]|nr:hypothetical protein [bacterium]